MYNKLLKQVFIPLIVLSIGFFSCQKNNVALVTPSIKVDSSSYSQLQVATFSTSNITFKQPMYNGFIGNKLVKICVSGSKLAFLVPNIPAGTYSLQTTIEGNECVFSIIVTALPTISNPNAIIQAALQQDIASNTYLDSLVFFTKPMQGTNTTNDQANVALLKNYTTQILSNMGTATLADNTYLAGLITANPALFTPLLNAITFIDTNRLSKTTAYDFEQKSDSNIIKLQQYLNVSSNLLLTTLAIINAPSQPLAVPYLVGASIGDHVFNALKFAIIIFNEPLINTGIDLAQYYRKTGTTMVVTNNQKYTLIFTGNFRNLCSLDINSPEPVIAGLNNSLATFGTFYTNLKAILPTPLVGNAIDLSSITSIKAKVLPLSIKYLSIVNVTNPLVLDSVDVSTGMLQVKFLTAQTSNQAFTFDILYNNPGVDSIRQTINGSIPGQRSGVIVAGGNGQGSALNQLNNASGIWINSITKSIYVSDQLNNRVVKWDSGITSGVLIAGGNGVGAANNQLISPGGIWMDKSGNLFVADKNNNRVMEWTSGASKGIPVAGFASAINNDSMLSNPSSVFVDANNIIYVSDQGNNRVQKWVPGIDVSTGAGGNSFGVGANQLNNPSGIFVDANGNIYIADTYNNRIQKWQPGTIKGITVAGGNGLGSAANQLARPVGLYVDGAGNMYIADKDNNRIQKWAPGAYSGITVATGDCNGVFLDASGNIFVLNIADVTKWGPM